MPVVISENQQTPTHHSSGSCQRMWQNIAWCMGTGRLMRENLRRACLGKKNKHLMDLFNHRAFRKGSGDLRGNLLLLLQMVLAIIDDGIYEKIQELKQKANELKNVTENQGEKSPGLVSGLNTDSSVIQTQLTMLVQRRQQLLDAINNAIKSVHDSDMNSVRRMV